MNRATSRLILGSTSRYRAELLRRLGRTDDARGAYERALELVHSDAERRFLERRLAELYEHGIVRKNG